MADFIKSPLISRQQGVPKPPSGGSARAELPVYNKAKPRLKQTNKQTMIVQNSLYVYL